MSDFALSLSSALQRRLVTSLVDHHPLPWRFQQDADQDWICEVIDATKKLVLTCAKETEAVELIDAAMAVFTENAKADLELDRAVRKAASTSTDG